MTKIQKLIQFFGYDTKHITVIMILMGLNDIKSDKNHDLLYGKLNIYEVERSRGDHDNSGQVLNKLWGEWFEKMWEEVLGEKLLIFEAGGFWKACELDESWDLVN